MYQHFDKVACWIKRDVGQTKVRWALLYLQTILSWMTKYKFSKFTFDYIINTHTNINLCCPHLLYNDSTQLSKTDIKILIVIPDNWP